MAGGDFVLGVAGNNAAANVVAGTATADERATKAFKSAQDNLDRLVNFEFFEGTPINLSLDDIDLTPVTPNFPDAPDAPVLNLNLPNFPPDIAFNAIPSVDFGETPTFDKEAPNLLFPATPAPSTAILPTEPSVDLEVVFPDAPVQVIPDVPTLLDLDIPDEPVIDLPVFTAAIPTQNIVIPGNTFFWSESPYTSTTLDAVRNSLLQRIQGGSGLDPTIENQIWDRAIQRESVTSLRPKNEQLQKDAQTGFARPSGSTLAALDFISQNTQNQSNSLSRDIAIKQAELEQENLNQTIQSIISLEQVLTSLHSSVQSRALDAEKFSQQVFFDIYNAEVAKYNVELETYKAFVLAFETQLKSEIQKLEVFKTQLEGQRLIGDLNQQSLQIYTASLQGLQTEVDLYKTQLEGINIKLSSENLKIQVFKTQVDAFNSQIQAKNSEYQGFGVAVNAEATKMDAFGKEVDAFASRIDAYAKGIDADKTVADVSIAIEGLKVQQQSLKLDTYSKTVAAELSGFQAQNQAFQSSNAAYGSQINAESARIQSEISVTNQKITHAQVKAQVALENAKISLANIEASSGQALAAIKATADVSSSLASAALAGLNHSSSVSHGLSLGNSLSESHSYDETKTVPEAAPL